jgi:cell wall-associated NlpC family hydrolase
MGVSAEPSPCTPGLKTIKNLLQTALEPVGSTLYIWGGGWFENKNGGNITYGSNHIGVHPEWKKFYDSQDSNYRWDSCKEIEKGLDCSGYVGWVIYNVMNTESGKDGYTCRSTEMAKMLSERDYGKYIRYTDVKDYKPGDIMSGETPRHVWICIGECKDKSVVFLHSSYQGVHICGTTTPDGKDDSEAYNLAKKYMKKYYKNFCDRYPVFKDNPEDKESSKQFIRDTDYLTKYNQMRWEISGKSIVKDPDNYANMSHEKILKDLFNEN